MKTEEPGHPPPDPKDDWVNQRQLCDHLGISQRTGSLRARAGEFHRFEHGSPGCGRRRYSRGLVERELQRRWERAVRTQDELFAEVKT